MRSVYFLSFFLFLKAKKWKYLHTKMKLRKKKNSIYSVSNILMCVCEYVNGWANEVAREQQTTSFTEILIASYIGVWKEKFPYLIIPEKSLIKYYGNHETWEQIGQRCWITIDLILYTLLSSNHGITIKGTQVFSQIYNINTVDLYNGAASSMLLWLPLLSLLPPSTDWYRAVYLCVLRFGCYLIFGMIPFLYFYILITYTPYFASLE